MTFAADMDGDVVGELGLDTVVDMDGESAGDVAVRLWMLTSVAVGVNGWSRAWVTWMVTMVEKYNGNAVCDEDSATCCRQGMVTALATCCRG